MKEGKEAKEKKAPPKKTNRKKGETEVDWVNRTVADENSTTISTIEAMTVTELKAALREQGLRVGGLKSDIKKKTQICTSSE